MPKMSSENNLFDIMQKSFRVSLGATTALVESLQDPQKREENWTKMQTDFGQLTEEWAEKGEVTEQEARSFVDNLMSEQASQSTSGTSDPSSPTTATPTADPDIEQDLQDLTAQIIALREELEKLRESESDSSP